MCVSCLPVLRDIFHTSVARCGVFVLKLPLNTSQLPDTVIESRSSINGAWSYLVSFLWKVYFCHLPMTSVNIVKHVLYSCIFSVHFSMEISMCCRANIVWDKIKTIWEVEKCRIVFFKFLFDVGCQHTEALVQTATDDCSSTAEGSQYHRRGMIVWCCRVRNARWWRCRRRCWWSVVMATHQWNLLPVEAGWGRSWRIAAQGWTHPPVSANHTAAIVSRAFLSSLHHCSFVPVTGCAFDAVCWVTGRTPGL